MSDNRGKDTFSQEVQHNNIAARVPERVARGTFSNGVLVLQGPNEFILDFLLRMNQPHQVAARVIVPLALMPNMISALQDNLNNYQKNFGQAPPAPKPPVNPPKPPTIEEIYDNLKIADEVLIGAYANHVLVGHTPTEFCFEFISSFYPKAVVSSRVFLSAGQVPPMLNTLQQSWQTFQQKVQQQQRQAPPPPPALGGGPRMDA